MSQDGRDGLNKEKKNRNGRAEGSRCARWISAGNSTSTGTHIQLPHGVAVTSSVHQKAQNPYYLLPSGLMRPRSRSFWRFVPSGKKEEQRQISDFKSRFGCSYIGPRQRILVTRQFPPPCFIAWSKRHHCSHANSLAKGPRPVEITPILWQLST